MITYNSIDDVITHLNSQLATGEGLNVVKDNVYQLSLGTNAGDMILIGALGGGQYIICNKTANILNQQSKVIASSGQLPLDLKNLLDASNLQYIVGFVQSFYGYYRIRRCPDHPQYYCLHEINVSPTESTFICFYDPITHETKPTVDIGGGVIISVC